MKRMISVVALVTALVVASASSAYGATSSVKRVSGASPYATCTAGAGTGLNYVNTEVEPYIAVNPVNTSNMIATWQQDRWSNGGAHGGASAYTTDGGRSWKPVDLPFSTCAPGGLDFLRSSDFWVSIGHDGIAYATGLPFDLSDGRGGVSVASSINEGATWGNSQLVYYSATNQFSPDKNSVTADPVKDGTAYAVWDVLVSPTDNPDDNPHTGAYTGDGYFSKTVNGGANWTVAQDIWHTSNRNQIIGSIIVVNSQTGSLYDFASFITSPNSASNTNYYLSFVRSDDGGSTWSQPQNVTQMFSVGVTDPNTGARLRVGDGIPNVNIDPASGRIYAVWEDSSAYKRGQTQGRIFDNEIMLTSSADGGVTWTTPVRVSTFTGLPAYTPNVAVNSKGRVAVTYYDTRELTPTNTTTLPVDFWITYSDDSGASFSGERKVMGPFNQLAAPYARGYFLGDYMGLATAGTSFVPAFAATNCLDNSCAASATLPVNAQDIFVGLGF